MSVPVLFVLLPNVLMLDLAGPAEVLRLAAQVDDPTAVDFDLQYVSPVASLHTSIGLPLTGLAPLPPALAPGTLVVLVGSTMKVDKVHQQAFESASNHLTHWLQSVFAPSAERLVCVCAGALSAARAGLLDGRQCTTHHSLCATLQAMAPKARVLENRLYVTDGPVSCSAGVTAGIDLMLYLVAELAGPRLACAVARDMVVYLRRSGSDPQLSPWISGRNHLHPAVHRVQDAIAAAPCEAWTVTRMAALACTGSRHLGRLFQEHVGISPLDYLHRLRLAVARELLAESDLAIETIAERAGFGSARHLRRIWGKYEAATPSAVRLIQQASRGT
ncbi:AraC family transcriptional regulator [Pseudomonas synxantha]|uniref:AraC family transcriptional regulator n=1 Tax=Pseudomonas libanensis TaxID=75588 RepID=A0ABR5M4H5_9PSED|nr:MULTISPECIES: helix-turn-helix domain-containing protein [Pseudomonas fluorescens group]AMS22927.1 AraC family transcriptional regulator [Pseudomonas synxantha]KPG73354.1 AraC family transcriptional regulator [Pseudomonas libanensis]